MEVEENPPPATDSAAAAEPDTPPTSTSMTTTSNNSDKNTGDGDETMEEPSMTTTKKGKKKKENSNDENNNNNSSSDPLLLAEEQQLHGIKEPHNNDVLSGRGVTTNRFPGNCSFRALVGVNKELYVSSTKREKMKISRSIVQAVRSLNPPGRFLDKDPETGLWNDIGHKKAIEKTSQALRDGAATLRKQLSADLGDPDFLNAVFRDDEIEVTIATTTETIESSTLLSSSSVSSSSFSGPSSKQGEGRRDGSRVGGSAYGKQNGHRNDFGRAAPVRKDGVNGEKYHGDANDLVNTSSHHSRNEKTTKAVISAGASKKKIKGGKAVKTPPVKKGHRRVKSNPSSLAQVIAADKAAKQRRVKAEQEYYKRYHREANEADVEPGYPDRPTSPGFHIYHHHHMYPPRSPGPAPPSSYRPPSSARSLPNSPMTWGGGPPPPPRYAPDGPPGSSPSGPYGHQPYHHPHRPEFHHHHHPTSPAFSPYGNSTHHTPYGRSHSFDQPRRPPPTSPEASVGEQGGPPPPPGEDRFSPRHHSWSPYGHHPHYPPRTYHPSYHHPPPPGYHGPTFSPRRPGPPPPGSHHRRSLPPPSPRRGPLSPGRDVRSPSPTPSHDQSQMKAPASAPTSTSAIMTTTPGGTTRSPHVGNAKMPPPKHLDRTPEWSPRRVNYHPYGGRSDGTTPSIRHSISAPSTPGHPLYTPERAASWSHSPHHDRSASPVANHHRQHPYHSAPSSHRGQSDNVGGYDFSGPDGSRGERDDHEETVGLSVPSLGGEATAQAKGENTVEQESPRLQLAPRSRPVPPHKIPSSSTTPHHGYGSLPPHDANSYSDDGGADRLRREFVPPRFSPRIRRSPTSPSEEGSIRSSYHCSPVEEEKKMTDVEAKEGITMMPSSTSTTSLTSSNTSTTERITSSSAKIGKEGSNGGGTRHAKKEMHRQHGRMSSTGEQPINAGNAPDKGMQEEQERQDPQSANLKDNTVESRMSPGLVIAMNKDGEGIEAVMSHGDMDVCDAENNDDASHRSGAEIGCDDVDDIPMSPLYDREDPISLMALPDDIMTLPISPCGPHDEHGTSAP